MAIRNDRLSLGSPACSLIWLLRRSVEVCALVEIGTAYAAPRGGATKINALIARKTMVVGARKGQVAQPGRVTPRKGRWRS